MKPNHLPIIGILCGLCLIAYTPIAGLLDGGSVLAPEPTNPGGPDLLSAFSKSDHPRQAAADARQFACLCEEIARGIEVDGQLSEPQLRTGEQFDGLRKLGRFYQLAGESYASKYQDLALTAGKYLEREVTNDGGPVTAERRAKWVAAYRTLAKSAHYASDYLAWRH